MVFLRKLKEISLAVLPMAALIFLMQLILYLSPDGNTIDKNILLKYSLSVGFVILGLSIFLIGVDNSINTMGELIGSSVVKFKRAMVFIFVGLFFGILITIAEPSLAVFSELVGGLNSAISNTGVLLAVALGVGIFVALAILKTLAKIPLKYILLVSYLIIFVLAMLAPPDFVPLSFDSGGVTTGPVTVPFLLTLSIGVAAVKSKNSAEDSFGMVALSAAGPIMAMLILGLVSPKSAEIPMSPDINIVPFMQVLGYTIGDVIMSVVPISAMFLVYQMFFIKLPKAKLVRMLTGIVIIFAGLVVFLTGVNYAFTATGTAIGGAIAALPIKWVLLPIGFVIGFSTVYTEPGVAVLGDQVENVTSGHISKKLIKNCMALAIGIAVFFGVLKVLFEISIWWFIVPGYITALILMFITPKTFVAIAFDSGGVASGPITATFTLPLIMGVAQSLNISVLNYAFGLVAMVSMMPLIVVQIMGIAYIIKQNKIQQGAEEFKHNYTFEDLHIQSDFDYSGILN